MKSRLQRWRVRISIFAAVGALAAAGVSGGRWEQRAPVVATALFSVGLVLVGAATLGRLWCSMYIAGRKTRQVVTEGPYSLCRHPLYFFTLVGLAGAGLCSETLLVPAALLLGFAACYPTVMRREEAELLHDHGEAYAAYAAATPRFLPRFSAFREPGSYTVNPRVFRKHLLNATVFLWAAVALEIMEECRDLGWLPVLWRIY